MKKLSFISTLCLSMAFLAATPAMAASSNATTVAFKKGSYSANYSGKVKGYNYDRYIFSAKKGQKLTVNLNSKFSDAVLYGYDDFVVGQAYTLPKTGRYEVRVLLPRAKAYNNTSDKYKLNIYIK